MATLVEFLNARLDEIERGARGAWINGERWRFNDRTGAVEVPSDSLEWRPTTAYMFESTADEDEFGVRITAMCDGEHIARHDPAYVLADVESKRAIIAHKREEPGDDPAYRGAQDMHEDVLVMLAQPFRDHPDFDPAWAVR